MTPVSGGGRLCGSCGEGCSHACAFGCAGGIVGFGAGPSVGLLNSFV